MNIKDIETALMFMVNCNYEHIYLQCKHARDIPLIKRALAHKLGDPSKVIDNTFYYGSGHLRYIITMLPVHREDQIRGIDPTRVFYIAYKDDSDWYEYCRENGIRQRLVPYEVTDWVTVGDVYTWLVRDGMTGDVALHKMMLDGLIDDPCTYGVDPVR